MDELEKQENYKYKRRNKVDDQLDATITFY
jgi:hypothetical protein